MKHAEARDLPFEISNQDAWDQFLKQNSKCALTGLALSMNDGRNPVTDSIIRNASLDRIDSSKGYTRDNIQWVHKDINKMKMDFPEDRFRELCRLVSEHTE